MTSPTQKPFYVGYLPTPPGLKLFLLSVGAALIGMFAGLAILVGAGQDDPGLGSFRWDWGAQTVTGTVQLKPYPVLHVTEGSKNIATGKSLLLSAGGKNGMQKRLADYDGKLVSLKGIALQRDDIDALQVGGGKDSIKIAAGGASKVEVKPLGRWRLKGEICPWHGFQYRLNDGCSPDPFTERVPTYNLRLNGEMVQVNGVTNALGTVVEPVRVAGASS